MSMEINDNEIITKKNRQIEPEAVTKNKETHHYSNVKTSIKK